MHPDTDDAKRTPVLPAWCSLTATGHMHIARVTLGVIAISVFAFGLVRQDLRAGAGQSVLTLEGDVSPVHDPVVIKEKGTYYVFCTGGRNGQGVLPSLYLSRYADVEGGRVRLRVAARVGRQGSADGA